MQDSWFDSAVSQQVWETRYRYRNGDAIHDRSLEDTWRRVAKAVAAAEPLDRDRWEQRFFSILQGFRFLPGGRILAGSGTGRAVTLLNCFVMGTIEDSMEGIFKALREGALTLQQGGGVGYDFSTLRPAGTLARRVGKIASGPVSFMRVWDAMCATVLSTGARRGAMMATLRCDHPDIEHFIGAKRTPGELRHFNLSVLVTDAFMQAVADDADWPLVFPAASLPADAGTGTLRREWPGTAGEQHCRVLKVVRARGLWREITRAAYDYAEPGVLFVDRINRLNNLRYCERICATNPCGEIPLPPYGACDLGSINLVPFVHAPFTDQAALDLPAIAEVATIAVRLLDDVLTISGYPLPEQRRQALATRRIGLGITGLGDALVMLGLHYGSAAARELAVMVMRTICHAAYRASVSLAAEKGAFSLLDRAACLRQPFIAALPEDIRRGIADKGIRNSHLTAIAPTGTISLLANNVSSGLEPLFQREYQRTVRQPDGSSTMHHLQAWSVACWRRLHGNRRLPESFVVAGELAPREHLAMQAALQPYVDSAISKTINIPQDFPFDEFQHLYSQAYALGLKGCTAFRPNPVTGAVLCAGPDTGGSEAEEHSCRQ